MDVRSAAASEAEGHPRSTNPNNATPADLAGAEDSTVIVDDAAMQDDDDAGPATGPSHSGRSRTARQHSKASTATAAFSSLRSTSAGKTAGPIQPTIQATLAKARSAAAASSAPTPPLHARPTGAEMDADATAPAPPGATVGPPAGPPPGRTPGPEPVARKRDFAAVASGRNTAPSTRPELRAQPPHVVPDSEALNSSLATFHVVTIFSEAGKIDSAKVLQAALQLFNGPDLVFARGLPEFVVLAFTTAEASTRARGSGFWVEDQPTLTVVEGFGVPRSAVRFERKQKQEKIRLYGLHPLMTERTVALGLESITGVSVAFARLDVHPGTQVRNGSAAAWVRLPEDGSPLALPKTLRLARCTVRIARSKDAAASAAVRAASKAEVNPAAPAAADTRIEEAAPASARAEGPPGPALPKTTVVPARADKHQAGPAPAATEAPHSESDEEGEGNVEVLPPRSRQRRGTATDTDGFTTVPGRGRSGSPSGRAGRSPSPEDAGRSAGQATTARPANRFAGMAVEGDHANGAWETPVGAHFGDGAEDGAVRGGAGAGVAGAQDVGQPQGGAPPCRQ